MQLNYLLILFMGVFLLGCDSVEDHSLKGELMPDVKVQNLHGEVVRFKPHGFDKPALLNVWATWCKPCIKEMPSLERLAAENDFRVIAISNDPNLQKVKDYVANGSFNNIQFYFDAFGRQSRQVLQASGLPITFLVDTNAYIQRVFLGEVDWQSEEIQEILHKYKVTYHD